MHERELHAIELVHEYPVIGKMRRHTSCSVLPTPMMKTFPPNFIDYRNANSQGLLLMRFNNWTNINGRNDATLHASALQRELQRSACCLFGFRSNLLGSPPLLNKERLYPRNQCLGEV